MTNNNKILVTLPTYNRGKNIQNIIDMMIKQIYTNFTLLLIDDGSLDKHLLEFNNLKEKYRNNDKFVFLNNDKNLKIPKTLNIGLKYFLDNNYDYFTWISDDNIYYPNFLSELLFNETKLFSYTGHHFKNDKTFVNQKIPKIYNYKSYEDLLNNFNGIYSFIWHRDAIKKIGMYNENVFLCEDYEYLLRTFKIINITDMKMNNICNMTYFLNKDSLFTRFKNNALKLKEQIEIIHKYLNNLNDTIIYYSNIIYSSSNDVKQFDFIKSFDTLYNKIIICSINNIEINKKDNLLIVPYNFKECIYNILNDKRNITYFTDYNLCQEISSLNKNTLLYYIIDYNLDNDLFKYAINMTDYIIYFDDKLNQYFKINRNNKKKYINILNIPNYNDFFNKIDTYDNNDTNRLKNINFDLKNKNVDLKNRNIDLKNKNTYLKNKNAELENKIIGIC